MIWMAAAQHNCNYKQIISCRIPEWKLPDNTKIDCLSWSSVMCGFFLLAIGKFSVVVIALSAAVWMQRAPWNNDLTDAIAWSWKTNLSSPWGKLWVRNERLMRHCVLHRCRFERFWKAFTWMKMTLVWIYFFLLDDHLI